jgi:fumarate reductase subunit D
MLSKKNENKTFWEKLDDTPSWVFFIVPIIVLAIPMLYPLGIPFEISAYTQTAFDQLEALDAGDTVVF